MAMASVHARWPQASPSWTVCVESARMRFAEIDLLIRAIPDEFVPGEWRSARQLEERRLIDQLYEDYRSMSEEESASPP